ncbi:MAG: hypothetical protein KGK07_16480 [Chloroflexota bacterium]|nr:hypothetical protein [Chloroflexota bacterium]
MTASSHDFCRLYLARVREEVRAAGAIGKTSARTYAEAEAVPTRLTALHTFRDNWTVEGDHGFVEEVEACCAWYARALVLSRWLDRMQARERQRTTAQAPARKARGRRGS